MITKGIATIKAMCEKEMCVPLFIVLSGSRGWGIYSDDSDFDIRFVYAYPAKQYLAIKWKTKDTMTNINGGLDIHGWDIRKALDLYMSSNCTIIGWLKSPLLYESEYKLYSWMNDNINKYFSPIKGIYHYCNMARSDLKSMGNGDVKAFKQFRRAISICEYIMDKKVHPTMNYEFVKDYYPKLVCDNLIESCNRHINKINSELISNRDEYISNIAPVDISNINKWFHDCVVKIQGDRIWA